MRFLALDIGARRTGVAFCDADVGIPLPLPTLTPETETAFVAQVMAIVRKRKVDRIFVGLPRLPDGTEGAQAAHVRRTASLLSAQGIPLEFIDERYTTPRTVQTAKERSSPERNADPDSAAACEILRISGKC